jgi:hypothetical protein
VPVERKGRPNPATFHQRKGKAIGEADLLIGILPQQAKGFHLVLRLRRSFVRKGFAFPKRP